MTGETIPVGLGELRTGSRSGQVLVCYGLGSCIGLALYDRTANLGALVHVVLPDSRLGRGQDAQPGKFADTAVPETIAQLIRMGASRARLIARAVGGARMLNVVSAGTQLDIGARNTEAVKVALQREGLHLTAEDTGGTYGRTVQLHIGSGRLLVSTVGRGEKEL